ncbi:MAG: aldo/keto reductase [Verrucomicrobiota bacterium]|nr:aldo/keto reductase [Verrucomicrobiota bacterium]
MRSALPLKHSFPIALGTAGYGTGIQPDAAFQLLDSYVEMGGNHLDTAYDYASWIPGGAGASERTIGQWLSRSGARNKLLIATKAGCTQGTVKRIRRDVLRAELAESLDRLGVEYVDMFWLHRDDPTVPVDEILDWMEELRRYKQIAQYGASNWTSIRIAEAQARALSRGIPGFSASQCGWNLPALTPNVFDTADAHFLQADDERWHATTGFPLVAYESQAGGFFSARYRNGMQAASSREYVVMLHYANATNWRRLEIARELASLHGCTPNQIVLAWMRHQSFPVISIIGARTVEQLQDSLGSVKVQLTNDECQRLRSADAFADNS